MRLISATSIPISLAAVIIAASILVPPAQGTMLAIALGDAPAYRLLDEPNVRLLGPGRLPGSLMINAELYKLWRVALRHKILLVNGPAKLCSGKAL